MTKLRFEQNTSFGKIYCTLVFKGEGVGLDYNFVFFQERVKDLQLNICRRKARDDKYNLLKKF